MTPTISAKAAAILDKPENSYWRPREKDGTIRVEAVEFAEAYFLAGPFDDKYGLVYIKHHQNARPLQEQQDAMYRRVVEACSTSYMPYSARSRLDKEFPDATLFHWDPVAKESYSDFDMPHISEELRARLETEGNRCQLFAQTPQGMATMLGYLTDDEQAQYRAAKEHSAKQSQAEFIRTGTYAERPYLVRLQGTDDASWSLNAANEDEVEKLLAELRTRGEDAVYELMVFTN